MSFGQELEEFVSTFTKVYRPPSARDVEAAEGEIAKAHGRKFAENQPDRDVNTDPSWAKDVPEGVPLSGGRTGRVPTFARSAENTATGNDIERAKAAIAGIESAGHKDPYSITGVNTNGDYPIGKYQVMAKNVPSWTRQALGQSLTPEQFRRSPEAQERVFETVFGEQMARRGFADAASIWHSGVPLAKAQSRADKLGTRTPDYVKRALVTYDQYGRPTRTQMFEEGGTVEDGGGVDDRYANVQYDAAKLTTTAGLGDIADKFADYAKQVFGFSDAALPVPAAGANPRAQEGVKAYAMNVGAASREQVQQIEKTVDPENKLNPAQRRIAMYRGMHDYWMDRGEPEKASRAVFAMGMAAKQAAQLYGQVAKEALERGDTKIAAEAIAKGYGEVPDGREIKITETTPGGATFQVLDANDRVTDQGKVAVDEMIRVATGMQDGSEFLKQWGAIRERAEPKMSAAQAQAESDREALSRFNDARGESTDPREFVATLSPEAREEYEKMSPRVQRQLRQEHWSRVRADQSQLNVETARGDRLDARTQQTRMKAAETAQRQGNWEADRERLMSNFERQQAARERDLDDRNVRHKESLEARQKRYEEIDKKVMQRNQTKGAMAPNAEERRAARVDETADRALAAAEKPLEAYPEATPEEKEQALAPQRNAIMADRTYRMTEAERRSTARNKADTGKISESLDAAWAERKGDPLPARQRAVLSSIAAQLFEANPGVTEELATQLALAAGSRDAPVKFEQDTANPDRVRVQFGNMPTPVVVSSDTLAMIAMVRGESGRLGRGSGSGAARPQASPAIPGVTGNPRVKLPTEAVPTNSVLDREKMEAAERLARRRQTLDQEVYGTGGRALPLPPGMGW